MKITINELIYENMDKLINKRKIYLRVYLFVNILGILPLFFIKKSGYYEIIMLLVFYILINVLNYILIVPSYIAKVSIYFDDDITYALNNDVKFEFRHNWIKKYIKINELEKIKEEVV